jgi:hypothetical protein
MGTGPSLQAPYDPRSRQFGRASAAMMPQAMHTMSGPHPAKACGCANDRRSVPPHDPLRSGTASDRTPLAHKLQSVIGGPACDLGRLLMPGGYRVLGAILVPAPVGRDVGAGGRPSLHGRFDPAGRLQHHVLGAGASTACVQQETFQPMPAAR